MVANMVDASSVIQNSVKSLKFIDLFAGIGGLRMGFANEGDSCVFSSEWDKNSQKTYATNFGEMPNGDITQIPATDIPEHDALLGGFPCQAFSVAGYRKGFEDTRGTLFFDIARILDHHRPSAFLLENVKNLLGHDKGRTLSTMLSVLQEDMGYVVKYQVLNTMTHANIPQNRERIFIVGFHPSTVPNADSFEFPKEIPLTVKIRDLIDKDRKPEKYYYKESHQYYPVLKEGMKSWETVYQWRRVYVRENQSKVCPTLTANMGTGGHNVPLILDDFGIRKLTPRECARFQGFPDSYQLPDLADSKLYYQIGNSVTVPVIRRIAEQMKLVMNEG